MEDLTEVITGIWNSILTTGNLFVYSSSKGSLRLCDMRASALCDKHFKLFEEPEDPSSRSFFSEIISSVSDVKFSHSGRYMLARDYLTVKGKQQGKWRTRAAIASALCGRTWLLRQAPANCSGSCTSHLPLFLGIWAEIL
uniref:Uncharacterized protein n=1 Tax=Podarcis muralis TaxID=64176 RepID=A0A670JTW4_PODMU